MSADYKKFQLFNSALMHSLFFIEGLDMVVVITVICYMW